MANYEEFMDPNSAIARIIQQMQGAATRSNPNMPPPGGAQPGPVGTGPGMPDQMGPEMSPEDLIAELLRQEGPRRIGGYSDR
jgi:hypothetical protein